MTAPCDEPFHVLDVLQARLAAAPTKASSRTYITSPDGESDSQFGSPVPPQEFLDPNANSVQASRKNDNDAYR